VLITGALVIVRSTPSAKPELSPAAMFQRPGVQVTFQQGRQLLCYMAIEIAAGWCRRCW
jgi:hypothetical protein